MKLRLFVVACLFSPVALADFGVGAAVGSDDASILFPIRFSSILVEPQFGYSNGDFEGQLSSSDSSEGYTVGFGLFGLRDVGNSLAMYYGARLLDIHEEFSDAPDPIVSQEVTYEGYSVTPLFGIQYVAGQIMVGAELGWQYSDVDLEFTTSFPGGSFSEESQTVSRGTTASVVFRYFLGGD